MGQRREGTQGKKKDARMEKITPRRAEPKTLDTAPGMRENMPMGQTCKETRCRIRERHPPPAQRPLITAKAILLRTVMLDRKTKKEKGDETHRGVSEVAKGQMRRVLTLTRTRQATRELKPPSSASANRPKPIRPADDARL
jgi:hypothetical protein